MTLSIPLWTLVFLVLLALAFDFMNGFHDAANSIATVVSTGVLKPHHAVPGRRRSTCSRTCMFELKVASTVGKGIVDPAVVDHYRDLRRAGSARSPGTSSPGGYGDPVELVARADRRDDGRDDRQVG
jgi:hypothetical protein